MNCLGSGEIYEFDTGTLNLFLKHVFKSSAPSVLFWDCDLCVTGATVTVRFALSRVSIELLRCWVCL